MDNTTVIYFLQKCEQNSAHIIGLSFSDYLTKNWVSSHLDFLSRIRLTSVKNIEVQISTLVENLRPDLDPNFSPPKLNFEFVVFF